MSKILSWAAVFLVMVLIFNLSSQVAGQSNQLSLKVTIIIAKILENIIPGAELDLRNCNNTLRKGAHFFSYLLLGTLLANALSKSGLHGYRCLILALSICILYAITDEMHQLYIPGRGGQLRDVLIDSAGAAVGVLGASLWRAALFKR